MNKITEALLFASLIYDEKNFHKKVRKFFPNCQIESFETQTDFYALVKRVTGELILTIRGTDGTDLVKWIKAWESDFKFELNSNGRHSDFDICGKMIRRSIIDKVKSVGFNHFKIFGHSRGGALALTTGYRIWKATGIIFEAIIFGAPPVGDDRWVRDINEAIAAGCKITYVVNPRDGMTTWFHKKCGNLPVGYDVGKRIELPPDSCCQKLFKKTSGVIEHSPKEYCDGCKIMYPEDKEVLNKIRKNMVN